MGKKKKKEEKLNIVLSWIDFVFLEEKKQEIKILNKYSRTP